MSSNSDDNNDASDAPSSDDEEEEKEWKDHPARKLLKLAFIAQQIPFDYSDKAKMYGGPRAIYDKYKDTDAFKRMPYDSTFTRRLWDLRDIVKKKLDRVVADQLAFDIYRRNHPIQTHNSNGELRWEGSEAERLLKEDMKKGLHIDKKPSELQATKEAYMQFSKERFRKHIHQEMRLWKMENLLEDKAKRILNKSSSSSSSSSESSSSNSTSKASS